MLKKFIKKIYCLLCLCLPHRKTIIFESGDNVFDNGFVFADFIARQSDYKKYKLICIGKRKEHNVYHFPTNIHYFSFDNSFIKQLKLLKYSLRAKYIFYSYDNYWKYTPLRKSTKIIFIRHGAFPIKSIKEYCDSMFDNQNHYYVLCTTPFVQQQLELKYPKKNVRYFLSGMPRWDLLMNNNTDIVYEALKIKRNIKIIIVACTFRHFDDPNSSFFKDEFPIQLSENELNKLNSMAANNEIVILFKLHHAQFCNVGAYSFSNIIFVDDGFLEKHEINNFDLFNASEALITDYSGIFIDYLLTDKPLGFILSDKSKYGGSRGFTLPNFEDYLPGEKILNFSDFVNFLSKGFLDTGKYSNERSEARKNFVGDYSNFSQSLIEEVKKL